MRIDRLELIGFGRFSGRSFEFDSGFNLVYGPNEAGKSTLLTFIEFMLYGAKKEGVGKRLYLPQHEQYTPWNGGAYQGRLVFTLANGSSIEVHRNFDRDRDETSIRDAALGKELDFPRDRRGEVLFARELLGMTRSVFLNTVMIPQMALAGGIDDTNNELQQDLLKALAGGSRDRSAASAMEILRHAIDAIGRTDRGKRDLLLRDAIARLQEELTQVRQHRERLQEHRARAHVVELDLERSAGILASLEWQQAQDRAAEMETRVARARDVMARIEEEAKALEKFRQFSDVDLRNADKPALIEDQLQAARDAIVELEKKIAEIEQELRANKEQVTGLNAFRVVGPNAVTEMIELRAQWRTAQENISHLRGEVESNLEKVREKQRRHEELDTLFNALGEDAGARIEELNRREAELTGELEDLTKRAGEQNLRQGPQRALSLAGAVIAVVSLIAAGSLYGLDFAGIVEVGSLWIIPAAIAVVAGLTAVFFRGRGGALASAARETSRLFEEKQEERKILRKERSTVLSLAGVKDYDGFIKLRSEYEGLRDSLADNAILIQQKRLPHLEDELEHLRFQIVDRLKNVGITATRDIPGDEEINRYIESVRTVRELEERHQGKLERRDELKKDLVARQLDLDTHTRELGAIYRAAGSRNFADFVHRTEGRRAFDKHLNNLDRQRENLENLLHGATIEALEKERDELRELLAAFEHREKLAGPFTTSALEEARQKVEMLRQERDTLAGTIETMDRAARDPGLVEVELAAAQEELERIARRRKALTIALETIEEATTRLHAGIAPLINETIGAYSAGITAGRYRDVKVDDTFAVRVRAPETNAIVPVQNLSAGARDQLFFAARLALADALSHGRDAAPLLLDDCFVEYDAARASEALVTLKRIAADRQVILFTCHDRERNLARGIFGASMRELDLARENDRA